MVKIQNPNHIPPRTGATKIVTVSVTMVLDESTGDTTALINAIDAIGFHINTNPRLHKDFVQKIEII